MLPHVVLVSLVIAIISTVETLLAFRVAQNLDDTNVHPVREIRHCDDVNVDVGRFVRVLLNLIKNSFEAMPKGGVLRLGIRQEGGWVIFRVGDTGCGIAPELQAKIFEPFVTFGKSKGTGLGMAIAKSVVETHGGVITVRSALGVGTTIDVKLPALEPESVP